MTLDSLNAFTVTVALQSVLWKYRYLYSFKRSNVLYSGLNHVYTTWLGRFPRDARAMCSTCSLQLNVDFRGEKIRVLKWETLYVTLVIKVTNLKEI